MPVDNSKENRRQALIRELMIADGRSEADVDRYFDQQARSIEHADAMMEQEVNWRNGTRASLARSAAQLELDGVRAEGFEAVADSIEPADLATLIETWAGTPEALEEALMDIRTRYAETRFDVAASISQAIGDIRDSREESGLSKFVAGMIGSDVAQLAIGGAEVLGRPQQVLFGLLSGEGGAAFQRLVPKVVMHDPSNGGEVEWTPIQATWNALTSGRDEWEVNMEAVRQANHEYADQRLLEFSDVVDTWAGEETMDEVYHIMQDQGIPGKIKMAALATGFATAEIFADPLILLDSVPSAVVKGGRKLGTTAQQAASSAKYARATNRLADLTEATRKAETHLDAMLQQNQIERSAESMGRLRQAERNYAERVDAVLAQKNAEGFDRVYTGPARGNPNVLATREVMQTPFEIIPDSPTRFNVVERAKRVVDDTEELLDRAADDLKTVSYTHLTLPTSDLV